MADYVRKVDGLAHAFTATLTDKNGPVDLPVGSSVRFRATIPGSGVYTIDALGTIVSPGALVGDTDRGAVFYNPVAPDLATTGVYDADWLVTLPDGTPQRFPEGGYLVLVIQP